MDFLKAFALLALPLFISGCQISYYMHSAYHQTKLLKRRTPIAKALKSEKLSEDHKRKLLLVQDVKRFAENELGLKDSSNYTSFVQLDEPYVTYIVQAAKAYELKPHLWKFPFVGEVPYKGYFKRELAEREARGFDKAEFDTFIRGVTAYSTLGWFEDAVLSSMMRYEDHDLAETIIHETVHTTLFIKSAAEFNERMATFLGHEGMKLYYRAKEGSDSAFLKRAEIDTHDQTLFSEFITREITALKKWYEDGAGKIGQAEKSVRLKQIQARFVSELELKLKGSAYDEFPKREINNAYLLAIRTYEYSLEDFTKLHAHFGFNFAKTLEWLKGLEKEAKPDQVLKEFVERAGASGA